MLPPEPSFRMDILNRIRLKQQELPQASEATHVKRLLLWFPEGRLFHSQILKFYFSLHSTFLFDLNMTSLLFMLSHNRKNKTRNSTFEGEIFLLTGTACRNNQGTVLAKDQISDTDQSETHYQINWQVLLSITGHIMKERQKLRKDHDGVLKACQVL